LSTIDQAAAGEDIIIAITLLCFHHASKADLVETNHDKCLPINGLTFLHRHAT
jgi:hypothetical protein